MQDSIELHSQQLPCTTEGRGCANRPFCRNIRTITHLLLGLIHRRAVCNISSVLKRNATHKIQLLFSVPVVIFNMYSSYCKWVIVCTSSKVRTLYTYSVSTITTLVKLLGQRNSSVLHLFAHRPPIMTFSQHGWPLYMLKTITATSGSERRVAGMHLPLKNCSGPKNVVTFMCFSWSTLKEELQCGCCAVVRWA